MGDLPDVGRLAARLQQDRASAIVAVKNTADELAAALTRAEELGVSLELQVERLTLNDKTAVFISITVRD